ncbi:MAG: hypothetical protein GWO10_21885, partial [candidate division Zixibacteria bacterium]|nr:hypothetical protein [Phycisphaerae bacterium]NIR66345.1 hypothetical protein [candidate division Zixibacteria bacterium]NIU27648.1 hypothetical protein [candidate division KSB1 bacterium]NIS54399.1 hypothetical protein [Phycisphaerae bacterium]NIW21585.1 hypothetical protein [candidate division KSB1 bacterium]
MANTTLTLSNGSTELDLSSITDFKQETKDDGFVLYYNQIYYPLKKTGKLQYDSRNNESTGIPRYYAWVDGVLKIYPFADRDYDLQVNYFKNYPKLTQYLDTNDFTEYAEDLITERALWYLYYSIEHEPEMAAIHKQAELDELERVLDFSRQKNASG